MRTPLAFKNLLHDRRRFALALAGVGFAVLLMAMQLGFQSALFASTVSLIRQLNADLVVTSQAHYTLIIKETFTRHRLYQAASHPAVDQVWPLYLETQRSLWQSHVADVVHPIRVLAFNPAHPIWRGRDVQDLADRLSQTGQVLFDRRSKPEYGPVEVGTTADLAGHEIGVAGLFGLGTDFAYDGNLLTSDLTFRQLFPRQGEVGDGLGAVDLGLVKLRAGSDPDQVRRELDERLPMDVKVQTLAEFEELEFWRRSTPIGYVFRLGAIMGFLVGVIICYQILYSDITEHQAEYATLKAMGYPTPYFVKLVLSEALWLSLLGFVPGVLVSLGCYLWLAGRTGLPLEMTWSLALVVLGLTVAMCGASALLTIRKVLAADPAELFR